MPLEYMSDEEVDRAITDGHAELCAVWRRLLATIGEHDRRGLYRSSACRTEAKHLELVLSLSWRTACDWVRVAHALDRQPRWATWFEGGSLSLDQLLSLITLAEAEQAEACSPLGPFDDPAPDPPGSGGPTGAQPDGGAAGGNPDPGGGADPSGGSESGVADPSGRSQAGWL